MKTQQFCYLFLLLLMFNTNAINAQHNNTQAALYNVGLGSFFGGIGAVINKKSQEKIGKVFVKGFWQGSLGGYVNFQSKKAIYNFANSADYKDAWTSKILNTIGNSIIHNAAANLNFWEKLHVNFAFNRLEFEVTNNFKTNYKIMPMALYGTIENATQGSFDFKNTLKTGHLIFKTKKINYSDNYHTGGKTIQNSILIIDDFSSKKSEANKLANEIIHVYQYNDFANINPIFNKPNKLFINNNNKYVKLYKKWFYSDFNGYLLPQLYYLQSIDIKDYYDNYFESEARYYSRYKN